MSKHFRKHLFQILFTFFFLSTSIDIFGQNLEVLKELESTVLEAPAYDSMKVDRIGTLRKKLGEVNGSIVSSYVLNKNLLDEFKVFNQDSAFSYGLRALNLAEQLDSTALIAEARLGLADVNVAAGMHKETLDMLSAIDPEAIPMNLRSLYYGLLGRVYSEMAEYSNIAYYSTDYNRKAAAYRQMALENASEGTFFHSFLAAFISYSDGQIYRGREALEALLRTELQPQERALVHYILGDLFDKQGEEEKAIFHFAEASIIDIRYSRKETLAIIRLSELLFETGDIRRASAFIKKANDDATFYGAQHRKIQVGAILPIIEEKVLSLVEQQRERLYRQNIIGTFLFLFVLTLAGIIYLQVRRLRRIRKNLELAHIDLKKRNREIGEINSQIQSKNLELEKTNEKLLEANKIKEEYIGFFFSRDIELVEKFMEFKERVARDIESGNLVRARYTIENYNIKKEKEKLLNNFDEAFIRLFPNFIEEFHSLLRDEERIVLKKGQILNKELRIFALMRLGIHHNDVIAQILGYSVNSIYAYKTRIRNKSRLPKGEFDEKLMENTTLKV